MKHILAKVKNIKRLHLAYKELAERDTGVPGMGLVHGFTGAGKTTGIAWLINQTNGVFVRATATWTPSAMLDTIMAELGAAPMNRLSQMVSHIIQQLAMTNRPLFVDEADYLLHNIKMLETLRDIHDLAGVPVVIIGMEGIERRIRTRQQFTRRLSQWVEFLPLDIEDALVLANTICDVRLADDLIGEVHKETKGSIGLMTVALSRIESMAKSQGWDHVTATDWGNRPMFLGKAPGKVL